MKTLDDFDFSFQRSVKPAQITHLLQVDFLAEAHNVVFLGPPGTGKSHLSIALGVQAARRGHRVAYATGHEWVLRLGAAKRAGKLEAELERLGRNSLLVVDEVGYMLFDLEAGALFFALISSRYERRSLIVNSNKSSSSGRRSSATRWWWRPWSTASCTTPRSSSSRRQLPAQGQDQGRAATRRDLVVLYGKGIKDARCSDSTSSMNRLVIEERPVPEPGPG